MKAKFNTETISLGKSALNSEPVSKHIDFLMNAAFGIYLLVMFANMVSIFTLLISPSNFFKFLFGF